MFIVDSALNIILGSFCPKVGEWCWLFIFASCRVRMMSSFSSQWLAVDWYVTNSEPLWRMQRGLRESRSPWMGSAARLRGGGSDAGENPDAVQVGLGLGPGRWSCLRGSSNIH